MSVRILDIQLLRAIGSDFRAVNYGDSCFVQQLDRSVQVIDSKSEMMAARGFADFAVSPTCQAGVLIGERNVNLSLSGLKPCSGKAEIRAGNFVHSQQPHIEIAGGIDISNDQSDMVERGNLDGFRICHAGSLYDQHDRIDRFLPTCCP